jgi:hypothetical protein
MKKEDVKKIRQAAAKLPPLYENRKVSVYGDEIIKNKGKEAKDRDDKPINPKLKYTTVEPCMVNHENKMKQVFQNAPKGKGHDAVFQYCQAVMDIHDRSEKEKAKKLETMSV